MSKTIIFTNRSKASATDFYLEFGARYPSESHPFSRFSFVNGSASLDYVEDFGQEGIYLVFDGAGSDPEEYGKSFYYLLDHCKGDDLYVLVHSFPILKTEFLKYGFRKPVEGMHEPGDRNYYYPIFDILSDAEGDKEGRIIKLLSPLDSKGVLNTAIKFFDACMYPGNDGIIQEVGPLLEDEEFGDIIKDFYYQDYRDENGFRDYKDYFNSLKAASDKVLAIIVDRGKKEKLGRKEGK